MFELKNTTQQLTVRCEYIVKIIDKPNDPGSGLNYLIQDHYLSDIKSSRNNISADLRLLTDIFQKHYMSGVAYVPELFNLGNILVYDNVYCTQEIKDKGYPYTINNVSVAYNFLLQLCNNPQYQQQYSDTKVPIHIAHVQQP